jgi:zinc transport system ATP-binding protein
MCIQDVSFDYGGETIIEHADLCIDEKTFISIVGPNGGGKTTLLKLVLGILKPSSGCVHVFGLQPENARAQIGYVPQRPRFDPHFPISVLDVVLTGRLGTSRCIFGCGRGDRDIARASLCEVGLQDEEHAPFFALSGGQQQRALIARALCCEPRMLLLDEPTANLDRLAEGNLYELLKSLSAKLTIVMVSHDLSFVSKYVERVVCVNREVHIHPIADFSSDVINHLYGADVRMVRHDMEEKEAHHHG